MTQGPTYVGPPPRELKRERKARQSVDFRLDEQRLGDIVDLPRAA